MEFLLKSILKSNFFSNRFVKSNSEMIDFGGFSWIVNRFWTLVIHHIHPSIYPFWGVNHPSRRVNESLERRFTLQKGWTHSPLRLNHPKIYKIYEFYKNLARTFWVKKWPKSLSIYNFRKSIADSLKGLFRGIFWLVFNFEKFMFRCTPGSFVRIQD